MKNIEQSPFFQFGAALAAHVFAPDYYDGPWAVLFRGKRRRCRNYATAKAWAKYLQRQGYNAALDGIYLRKDTAVVG